MSLNKWQTDILAFEIARDLAKAGLVVADAERLERTVHEIVAEDLGTEERLNVEVAEILKTHAATMRQQGVDYATFFEKVKRQLIRERKLVL